MTELPDIEDNAKGVEPQQLCRVYAVALNGQRFQFPPTPRELLEMGIAFGPLVKLHDAVGGLKRIWVEVCEEEPVIQNAR